MRYIALLRGVNVGGKGAIKMAEVKRALEKAGYDNVFTYINSGNILFDSESKNSAQLTLQVERLLKREFFEIRVVVLSSKDLQSVLRKAPADWRRADLRKYIAFMKAPSVPEDLIRDAKPKQGVDFLEKGPGVVYMSTKMSGLTKSGLPKLISSPAYANMTMRNYTTVLKLAELMQE